VTSLVGNVAGTPLIGTGGAASSSNTTTTSSTPGGTATTVGTVVPTWREDHVVLVVDASFLALPNAKQVLQNALLAWTAVASELPDVELVDATVDANTLTAEAAKLDHRISFAANGEPRANGALAITLLSIDEKADKVLDGDLIFNGEHTFTNVDSANSVSSETRRYDLQNVLTHELGHWFGLGDDYVDTEATMYGYIEPLETKKRDLSNDDLTQVQVAYWRANNPSKNIACAYAVVPISRSREGVGLGCLAAMLLLRRRSNQPKRPIPLSKTSRLP
jgi:hypothetical protein